MQPSLTLCRAQEAHHLALSRAATLLNVKTIADAAAAAWAKEGLAASARDRRKLRNLAAAEALTAGITPGPVELAEPSEMPDRGTADRML
jgi:hypothetical protein